MSQSAQDRPRISANGLMLPIGPADAEARVRLEALVAADYARYHPNDSFEGLKQRARFAKEDQGLLQDWMRVAVMRARAAERSKG
jgi:hypothetical protein